MFETALQLRISHSKYHTLMQNLRPNRRIHAVAIAILPGPGVCRDQSKQEPIARFFFGFFCLASTGVLVAVYRKETSIAKSYIAVSATVTEVKRGRHRNRYIKYQFVAFNGKQYGSESDWATKPVGVGTDVLVLYQSLDPAVNLPSKKFLFYSFDAYGS